MAITNFYENSQDKFATFAFIAGVVGTDEKLFTGVNDTGDKSSLVSLLPASRRQIFVGVGDTGDYALVQIFIDSQIRHTTPATLHSIHWRLAREY